MIVSASRRTDLPAFYSEWFMNRIRAGWCEVPNPFNRRQVTRVSLLPEDVDAIVFWTRNPRPLMRHLDELDARGFRYEFLYTLIGYPREIDPHCPASTETFRELASRAPVVWRYDPVVLSEATDADWHRRQFARLARALEGATDTCKVSLVDAYAKTARRLRALEGTPFAFGDAPHDPALMRDLAALAASHGIRLESCAETEDLRPSGIPPGRCIDPERLGLPPGRKDPGQRPACGCAVSRDIGMYDSCRFGCAYCYAVRDFARVPRHDPEAPSLL